MPGEPITQSRQLPAGPRERPSCLDASRGPEQVDSRSAHRRCSPGTGRSVIGHRGGQPVNLPRPSEEAILNFYTAQIEAAKALQRRWMNQQTIGTQTLETFTDSQRRDARDRLNLEIRPILLDLGKRMASLIVQGAASSSRPNTQVIASCLQHHALPQEQSRALVEAMVHATLR